MPRFEDCSCPQAARSTAAQRPIYLITALPGDNTRAPQAEFTRARELTFLENLSVTSSVRSVAA